MKKINKFLESLSMWETFFLHTLIFFSIVVTTLYHLLDTIVSLQRLVVGSLILSMIFSFLSTTMHCGIKRSIKFWTLAKIVNDLLENCEDDKELSIILNTDYQELLKLAQGGPHYVECRRLKTIINIKSKYLCK